MTKSFSLNELAKLTGSTLQGDGLKTITGISDLESATPSDASFLSNNRYLEAMKKSSAGVVFVESVSALEGKNFLINSNPSLAFQKVLEEFHGTSSQTTGFKGIHPSAIIHETASVDPLAVIGPHAVIDEGATVGPYTQVGSGCYIGPFSTIGSYCHFHPNATIRERTIIGDRVIIQPGAVIGSCGFGLTTDSSGSHSKLNQVGNVVIEDDVEIGANTTIDRARFKSTIIKKGVKIDNLVQIAHKVIVGEHSIIVAQTGIAGSSEIGKGVILASQVGVAGHLKIADGSILTARTGVSKSLTKPGEVYGGAPAMVLSDHNKVTVMLRNIRRYVADINELKKKN